MRPNLPPREKLTSPPLIELLIGRKDVVGGHMAAGECGGTE